MEVTEQRCENEYFKYFNNLALKIQTRIDHFGCYLKYIK